MLYNLLSLCFVICMLASFVLAFIGYAKFTFQVMTPVLALIVGLLLYSKGYSALWAFILPIVGYTPYLYLNHYLNKNKISASKKRIQ